jgi:CheY-like chemotaxis protein
VLLVEDDASTRDTLSTLLSHAGHYVTAAEDGPAAVLLLRQRPFDVVLTDRAMPIMSGDELAMVVKSRYPSTAVVLVTGMGGEMVRRDQQPEGVNVILPKPVSPGSLELALARAMDQAGRAADTNGGSAQS